MKRAVTLLAMLFISFLSVDATLAHDETKDWVRYKAPSEEKKTQPPTVKVPQQPLAFEEAVVQGELSESEIESNEDKVSWIDKVLNLSVFRSHADQTPSNETSEPEMGVDDSSVDSSIAPVFEQELIAPQGALVVQASSGDDVDQSSIYGLEVEWAFSRTANSSFGLLVNYQSQEYGRFSEDRMSVGLSAKRFYRLANGTTLFGGAKYYYNFGLGQTEEALDCLYCSNKTEDYSGNNGYLTVGAILQSFAVSLDYRVTDNLSDFSETSYDPWGVGSNYSRNFKGIPDPELIVNIGASF